MAPARLNDISHRRFNPLTGAWVLVSPSRNKHQRPWQGQEEDIVSHRSPSYDPKCYLCPGNIRARGNQNPQYSTAFIFENDYQAVTSKLEEFSRAGYKNDSSRKIASTLLHAQPVTGRCYVLIFSARHDLAFGDMKLREMVGVIEAWTALYARYLPVNNQLKATTAEIGSLGEMFEDGNLAPATKLRYMNIFENRGALSGCSNHHPHCQIWITSTLPEEPGLELAQMRKYREEHCGRHLLEDYIRLELEVEERIVWQNDGFLVVCPWWAVWPFEVLVLPKRHIRALVDFNMAERAQFAEAIQQVIWRYDSLFGFSFPYNSGIHQAPLDATEVELNSSYLHMHFYPPLLCSSVKKFFGGYELFAEPLRDFTPEEAAARLRAFGVQQLTCEAISNKTKSSGANHDPEELVPLRVFIRNIKKLVGFIVIVIFAYIMF